MQDHKHALTDPGHGHAYIDKYKGGPSDGHYGPDSEDTWSNRWDASHDVRTSNAATGAKVNSLQELK